MNHDDLVSLCSSFYDEVEIKDVKRMLFNLLECDGDLVERRNDARKKNISDMVRLLSTSQQNLRVKFCVTNTRRLPPVSLDHIDVAALMKALLDTKTELIKCQNAQLRTEEKCNDEFNRQNIEIRQIKESVAQLPTSPNQHVEVSVAAVTENPRLNHAPSLRNPVQEAAGMSSTREDSVHASQAPRRSYAEAAHGDSRQSGQQSEEDDGFTTVNSRLRRRRTSRREPVMGTKQGNRLRVASSARRCHVWVYNLHVDCTAAELESYIKEMLDDDEIQVEKLQLKRTDSSAFIVSCHNRHYDSLLKGESWENDVRVRPYRLPRQNTTA